MPTNEESKKFAGAYMNCWVNSEDETTAKNEAVAYICDQGWQVLHVKEIFIVNRGRYLEEPDSLACFNQAINFGIGAMLYT